MSFGLIARALAIRPVEIRLTFSVVSMRGVLGAGAILSMLFLASSYISTGRRESELLTLVENHVDGLLLEYQMACMRIYPQAVIAAVESEDDEITCPTALLKWAKETGTS